MSGWRFGCLYCVCVPFLAWAQPHPVVDVDGLSPASRMVVAADGQPISLNFQNIDVRALLQVFAEFSGLNLVVADSVTGQISVRLVDVPWVQALGIVLQSKGLTSRREGNVLWVAPREEWALREKKHLESQAALEAVSPLQMLPLRLQYARATEVVQRLMGGTGAGSSATRWLSPRGSAMAEPRTNQLFVLDVPGRLADVNQMIQKLDVPIRQVLIEAQIVEADDQFGQSLGVRLGLGSAGTVGARHLNLGASNATSGAGVEMGNQVNLPAGNAGQTLNVPSTFAVSLFNAAADRFINVEISALEADGRGKVVSRPRVITADQTKALIEQGTELPYQMSSGIGVTAITFRKANLKLEVTPQITPEGAVVLDVDVNRDSVGQLTPAGYAINTKHVKTQVQVDDGGTVVLGGIYEDADRNDEAKVPGLADVPGLGWLFKNRNQTRRKSELLIFLTPRVVLDAGKVSAQ
ncbi:type IV pilus secretin PilQ [Limnohabitans sp. Jir72]|uniref:type IV pilus secretin PilQ n=1 Tax=Limnohabitans sp. Jir72 TaxID=1977909 RepID=UPI000D3A6922|nr:type IV pilus secretin PilQ [Limnohabitans sp. Jir72]PUE34364.1 pilus assembly protein PilQ [Limnohabitans sp. Jir72]